MLVTLIIVILLYYMENGKRNAGFIRKNKYIEMADLSLIIFLKVGSAFLLWVIMYVIQLLLM